MYFAFLQKQTVSINSAAERVRITLKEIGTLTYACPSADDLILLDEQLKAVKSAFQEKLPTVEGLVIRPAVVAISNLYDFALCSIKILMQKLIMTMSSLVDHEKAHSLPFQTKFVLCKSGEYFRSYALTIFLT